MDNLQPSLTELIARENAIGHSQRFRKVANGYPRAVALAYDRDIFAAAVNSDDEVAARVAEWERATGLPVRDWWAIGTEEGKIR